MSRKSNIIIHVGYPKTGTTYLQDLVFTNIKDINYVELFHKVNIFEVKIIPNKINLISDERLIGDYYNDNVVPVNRYHVADGFTIANRIHKVFPDARIIVGIRDKEKFVRALYSNYLHDGGLLSYEDFFGKIINKDVLNFEKYINHLKALFYDVYVYKLEDLKKDSKKFVKNICDFIGCEVPDYDDKVIYKSFSDNQMKVSRFLNKFWRSKHNSKGLLPFVKYFNPSFIVSKIFKNI